MLPIVELRGAIPIGVGLGLHPVAAMLISIAGNMVPVPFIILFIRRVFEWMRGKSPKLASVVEKMEAKAYAKRELIRKWELLGLFVLVAVPLPGTGAWTGALVAAIFDIRLRSAIPTILAGVVVAGFIITGITVGFASIFA
ncbi:MAG: small multi-drug export protein [Oscillospiraceae bacterium]|nr:small multi-drug export protein [Oscillospiraceae bacterium]